MTLNEARKAAGMTQGELAARAGVGKRQIQKLEAGEIEAGNMSARNLLRLAKVLDADPWLLIGEPQGKAYMKLISYRRRIEYLEQQDQGLREELGELLDARESTKEVR